MLTKVVIVIHSPKGYHFSLMQILSTNHLTVASMHLGVWSWLRQSPELQTECQNGKERCSDIHANKILVNSENWTLN